MASMDISMVLLNQKFSICRFSPNAEIPSTLLGDEGMFHISKTKEELSIVCRNDLSIDAEKTSGPYSCLKVVGPLDFSLVGIISRISEVLRKRDIPVFVVSTFDTDYIFVNNENEGSAIKALNEDEYISVTITPN